MIEGKTTTTKVYTNMWNWRNNFSHENSYYSTYTLHCTSSSWGPHFPLHWLSGLRVGHFHALKIGLYQEQGPPSLQRTIGLNRIWSRKSIIIDFMEHIITWCCHLLVSCTSLVDWYNSLGSSMLQIMKTISRRYFRHEQKQWEWYFMKNIV